jgi:hypothetical protein
MSPPLLRSLLLLPLITALHAEASSSEGVGRWPHKEERARHPEIGRPYRPLARAPAPRRPPAASPRPTVYAYWPGWSSSVENVPYAHITHLALFGVDLESDGSLDEQYRVLSSASAAVSLGHEAGVRVHMTLMMFSDSVMASVLPSASRRATAVSALASLVRDYGLDGVNVDAEGLDADLKDEFTTFIRELKAGLPAAQDDVVLAMPAVDWGGAYDYDELALASDALFVMGYAYYWTGGNPGPNSPLHRSDTWGSRCLEWTLQDYRDYGAPDASIVIGLPLYGQEWPTTGTGVPGSATASGWSVTWVNALAAGREHGRLYDSAGSTAYAFPDATHQLWYDDVDTLREKIAWAMDEGLQGIGFWAVNYDEGDPELWAMVAEETRPSSGEDTGTRDSGSDTDEAHEDDGPGPDGDAHPRSPPSDRLCPLAVPCEGGCGCASSRPRPGLLLALIPALLLRRARKRYKGTLRTQP